MIFRIVSDWQICHNDKYGFEFKYPPGWIVENVGHPRDKKQIDCSEVLPVPGYNFRGVEGSMTLRIKNRETQDIWREDFTAINSLDDYIREVLKRDPDQSNKKLIRSGGMKMLGGEKLYWTGLGNGNLFGMWSEKGKLLITYHKGNIYEFRTSVEANTLDNILLSFKFTEPVACTQDAKQCPDGSYVGRVAPNCEFTACPVVPISNTPPTKPPTQIIKPLLVNPISICNNLTGTKKSVCVEKLAVEQKNSKLCDVLLPGGNRDGCYLSVAVALKDYSVCEKIKLGGDINYHNYYNCRSFTSIALNDINTCRSIVNQEDLQKTERELRAAGVDERLIQEDLVTERESYRSWCTFYIALNTKNVTLCNFLPEVEGDLLSKTPCTYVVQQCVADPKSCEVPN